METEPVSYDFPGHPVGAMAPPRLLNSHLGPNFFYSNPTSTSFLPFHSSSAGPYGFGHHQQPQHHHHHHHPPPPLSNPRSHQHPHHHHHHVPPPQQPAATAAPVPPPAPTHPHPSSAYQPQFLMASHQQQPLHPQPVRLSREPPPPLQGIPDIRPAKNAINHVPKDPLAATKAIPGSGASPLSSPSQSGSQDKSNEVDFSTEVDVLMKAIQSKASSETTTPIQTPQSLPSLQQLTHGNGGNVFAPPSTAAYTPANLRYSIMDMGTAPAPTTATAKAPTMGGVSTMNEDTLSRSGKKRKYTCTLLHCGKSFAQKTHLDIHMRAHTGDKPFTHQRRHTGEKPFSCDICHKRFAQRGNVRAHKITHLHEKPFTCLLDDCGKQFTQLGNLKVPFLSSQKLLEMRMILIMLKSHQNKFHATTLRNLTIKFSTVMEGDPMNPQDRELWGYFATLYKNSNKGIKGRGKDRKISPSSASSASSSSSSSSSSKSVVDATAAAAADARRRFGSYEDSSVYTGPGSSSDEDEMGHYYLARRH